MICFFSLGTDNSVQFVEPLVLVEGAWETPPETPSHQSKPPIGGAAEVYFVYYFRIEMFFFAFFFVLKKSCDFRAGAVKVYFVYYLCDERSENSPAKVPRWGPRFFVFLSQRWRFPEQGLSDNRHMAAHFSGRFKEKPEGKPPFWWSLSCEEYR